jgi:ribosomal protein S18 acetylase RimI-like enzyme
MVPAPEPSPLPAAEEHNRSVDVKSFGYRTDLAILRLEGSQTADCGDHMVIRSSQNPGFRWGNFILLAVPPRRGELSAWVSRFGALFPRATYQAIGVDVTDAAAACPDTFAAAGFRTLHSVVLTASSLSQVRQPNQAAAVRRLDGDEDWQQSAALRAACSRQGQAAASPADREFDELRLAARRRIVQNGLGAWFGAFVAGRLVAHLGLVPVGDGNARYQDVETHPEYRRRGLAGMLIWHAGRLAFAELDASGLVIVADPASAYHAKRLYESLGFVAIEDQVGFVRGAAEP